MADGARRVLNTAQLVLGVATLSRPDAMVSLLTPAGAAHPDRRIVRVLGLRQLVQGVVGVVAPTGEFAMLGAVIDAAHATSLLPVIAFSRKYRAAAAVSAGLASAAAVAGAVLAEE